MLEDYRNIQGQLQGQGNIATIADIMVIGGENHPLEEFLSTPLTSW